MEFKGFPKVPRLRRELVVTEKIDGTNAQVALFELNTLYDYSDAAADEKCLQILPGLSSDDSPLALYAGSRNRYVTPDNDNFGFARWVVENQDELRKLGPGRHYGEWWGAGIQRRYGLDHKRFSLFNVNRWMNNPDLPACCHIVPVIVSGVHVDPALALYDLARFGSWAAPGYKSPEGIMVFHTVSRSLFKMTIDNDGPKGAPSA